MKLFYDTTGNVVGSVEGATPVIEANIKMPDTSEIQVPDELLKRFADPTDKINPHTCKVEGGQIREFTAAEYKARDKLKAEQQKRIEQLFTNPPKT